MNVNEDINRQEKNAIGAYLSTQATDIHDILH